MLKTTNGTRSYSCRCSSGDKSWQCFDSRNDVVARRRPIPNDKSMNAPLVYRNPGPDEKRSTLLLPLSKVGFHPISHTYTGFILPNIIVIPTCYWNTLDSWSTLPFLRQSVMENWKLDLNGNIPIGRRHYIRHPFSLVFGGR